MNLKLVRSEFSVAGVFSRLWRANDLIAVTLEHSYRNAPKLGPGIYKCVRGMHQLHGMKEPFETFEITGVEGHTNILFHVGNYNKDSEGCVLIGTGRVGDMIVDSRSAFEKLMEMQSGVNEFELEVTNG